MTNTQSPTMHVESLHLFPGACFGLMRKTALARIALHSDIDLLAGLKLQQQLRDVVSPQTAQEDTARITPPVILGQQVRDLLLLVLSWSREPIFEARLLGADAATLTIAVGWERERTLREALDLVVQLIEAALHGTSADFGEKLRVAKGNHPAATPLLVARLTAAAYRKNHPVEARGDFVQLGWGSRTKRLAHAMTQSTSAIAVRTARWKFLTNRLLAEAGVPVPSCFLETTLDGALKAARRLNWPVVVKPSDMDGGIAVSTGIDSDEALARAFEAARIQGSGSVLVERHVHGHDHRLLVVRDKLLIATRRTPGGVTGDGKRAIAKLVEVANADPRRGIDKQADLMIRLALDDEALECLAQQGLGTDSIAAQGQFVRLRHAANISQGGTAEDVTEIIHPDNRALALRAARIVGLDIAGIDLLCPDIAQSWRIVGGAICEVNAQPMLRVHWLASPERDIEGEIIDCIVDRTTTRIPVMAVTGHGDITATALVLHDLMNRARHRPGTCTQRGVRIGLDEVYDGDAAGFHGSRMVLADPLVDNAILALTPLQLAQLGHPCDRYDIVAVVPRSADQRDTCDQYATLERLARDVVDRARSTIILHASDRLHHDLRLEGDKRRHILVGNIADDAEMHAHLAAGGECIYLADRAGEPTITVAQGAQERPIIPLCQVIEAIAANPRMIEATLFASGLAIASGLSTQALKELLSASPVRSTIRSGR